MVGGEQVVVWDAKIYVASRIFRVILMVRLDDVGWRTELDRLS